MIKAEVHTDDGTARVNFDATGWFEQAEDVDILALADIEWGGDYAADDVALWFEDKNTAVASVLEHADCGYECHVNPKDALAWLKEHKPDLWEIY